MPTTLSCGNGRANEPPNGIVSPIASFSFFASSALTIVSLFATGQAPSSVTCLQILLAYAMAAFSRDVEVAEVSGCRVVIIVMRG